MNGELFREDPRSYALGLVEEGLVSGEHLALVLLKYLSHDDVREALEMNELEPETLYGEEEEEE